MRCTRFLMSAVLLVSASATLAQPPFVINGLDTDQVFADAKAAVEALGGQCRVKPPRTPGEGVSAQCVFTSAGEPAGEGSAPLPAAHPGLAIGAQPITRIGMEAPADSAQLTRIVFEFEGELEVVARYLEGQYGPPDHGASPAEQEGWSHSRRRGWIKGNYTLGLIDTPTLVILTVNR